ncbi:MAG: DUF4199 domain-containing protein [Bacteroidia bacterium]|nr:DUF4199 domain-containing protein [Bacteroidia bacterium]NNM22080.1 DUF4199 domain-containing protein [Flavobacteriaceae bacterium]
MDNSTPTIKKSAINYGLILGGILAAAVALLYAISLESLTKWWLGIILFLVALTVGIVSVAKSKSILGGFISFKQAFTSYFITIAIGLFISVLMSIVIFNVVDTGAAEYLNEQVIEITRSMMERFGAPEAEVEKALAELEGKNNYSVGNQLQSFVFQLVFYSIFGLLIALIMKRKDPNSIN